MAFQSSMTVDIFILQFLHDFRFQNNCIFFNDNAYDDNGDEYNGDDDTVTNKPHPQIFQQPQTQYTTT